MAAERPPAVAFVLKGYPRLSETFIAQEILALERAGMDIRIVSLRHPTDRAAHPVHAEIAAPVAYLPEYLWREPLRVWRGWLAARRLPGYRAARAAWLRDLRRDATPNRIRRFGQALALAAELPAEVARLHAHFLHTPASVARYAAKMRGLGWSASAHAKDIWTTPGWEKREKLADAAWAVTCSAAARTDLAAHATEENSPALFYHGLDLARFPAPGTPRPARNGSDPADPVRILTVGRAVEKKGHDVLIRALAALPPGLHWRWTHIGGGKLLKTLKAQAADAGIAARIDWRGSRPQAEVLEALRESDLFALASRVARDGDRDGLPNVLLEAQSQALACVATGVSGVPELLRHGETGLIVPPEDAVALAEALATLIADPARRSALGAAGLARVREAFDAADWAARLAMRFAADGLAPPEAASRGSRAA